MDTTSPATTRGSSAMEVDNEDPAAGGGGGGGLDYEAPPRRRRRSQRKSSNAATAGSTAISGGQEKNDEHRMSVSDSGESNLAAAAAAVSVLSGSGSATSNTPAAATATPGETAGKDHLESDGDGRTGEDIDEDIIDDDEEDEDYDEDDEDYSEAEALDYDTYYSFNEDLDDVGCSGGGSGSGGGAGGGAGSGNVFNNNDGPEYFAYECLTVERAEKSLQDQVSIVCNVAKVSPSEAKLLLHLNGWVTSEAIKNLPASSALATNNQLPSTSAAALASATAASHSSSSSLSPSSSATTSSSSPPASSSSPSSTSAGGNSGAVSKPPARPPGLHPLQATETFLFCDVCAVTQASADFSHLSCRHLFCKGCWENHFGHQILQGLSTSLSCMSSNCDTRAHEDFVLAHVTKESVRQRFKQLAFFDYIRSHPQLRFCPGNNCKYVVKAEKCVHKRATCTSCKTSFCYQCGGDYHAPTDCETIKRWLTRCADDSETANYISANTKDCPKCNICIEKNGGCNHMQCYRCKHDFCWMCLGDWKTHGSEYYECSRYKENPNIAHESAHAQAREALKKYLHYFERWENHSNSMKLEAQTLAKIKSRINEKVMKSCGTWIDWQYLLDAAALLAKCRYTLQYTYPYAYYMEPSNRKKLFECQQAQLEAEIENLSWKIEHAEITDRGDLENQMNVAEKRRTSLLKDFLPS